jgi:hypothetical protein
MSVILVPWWWSRRQARGWLAVFALLAMAVLLGHPTLVGALVGSLSAVSGQGSSNASLYPLLSRLGGSPALAPWLAMGLWGVWLIWWARRAEDPLRYLFGALLAAVALSPAVHPWYLTWLVPFACFVRAPAVLWLTIAVVLVYTKWPGYLADGRWAMPAWAYLTEYLPVVLLGLWEAARRLRPSRSWLGPAVVVEQTTA